MVVGEPTLMGGEFGDEDERLITRLENTQYEPNGAEDEEQKPGQGQPPGQNNSQGQGNGNQFQNSPSLHSPWNQDKKTPQPALTPADDKPAE